ncbi:hypothetical protein HMPREF3226_01128 [Prevotella corporis]|uniref:Uncharacterized protein n=1 Tax=Prevotella corporis TaxID=28128 RepID=A0A133QAK5_9BACT|nr:hypothetical protein HMPREF3226_01128 [Prevotella corporis]
MLTFCTQIVDLLLSDNYSIEIAIDFVFTKMNNAFEVSLKAVKSE